MKKIFFSLFLLLSVSTFAALPPLSQSSREIQRLLSDSQLQTLLGSSEVIEEVVRTESGYVILTQKSLLRVDIEYLAQERPGPQNFTFHFYPPVEFKASKR